jgi:GAF domain-containing protein
VLNVNAPLGRSFTEYDLRALAVFAEQASLAIANARLYEAERAHVAALLELRTRKEAG